MADLAPPSLRIERVKLAELVDDAGNPRVHTQQSIGATRGSIRRWGHVRPLIVQAGTNRIIGGHGTRRALLQEGVETADAVVLEISDEAAGALCVALNRTQQHSHFAIDELAVMLEALRDDGGLEGVGYSEADIARLRAELEAGGASVPGERGESEPSGPRQSYRVTIGPIKIDVPAAAWEPFRDRLLAEFDGDRDAAKDELVRRLGVKV